jgi:hypothetical protein
MRKKTLRMLAVAPGVLSSPHQKNPWPTHKPQPSPDKPLAHS